METLVALNSHVVDINQSVKRLKEQTQTLNKIDQRPNFGGDLFTYVKSNYSKWCKEHPNENIDWDQFSNTQVTEWLKLEELKKTERYALVQYYPFHNYLKTERSEWFRNNPNKNMEECINEMRLKWDKLSFTERKVYIDMIYKE